MYSKRNNFNSCERARRSEPRHQRARLVPNTVVRGIAVEDESPLNQSCAVLARRTTPFLGPSPRCTLVLQTECTDFKQHYRSPELNITTDPTSLSVPERNSNRRLLINSVHAPVNLSFVLLVQHGQHALLFFRQCSGSICSELSSQGRWNGVNGVFEPEQGV